MTRAERHIQIVRLRGRGMTFKGIAAYLGLALSTVTAVYYDPTGEADRARKAKADGACLDCGGRTVSDGGKPPERCRGCDIAFKQTVEYRIDLGHTRAGCVRWTDEAIFQAMHRARTGGRLSTNRYRAFYEQQPRGSMPSMPTITKRFDTWANAIKQAGLPETYSIARERLTPERCRLALADAVAALGHIPSYTEYEAWAKQTGSPSGPHLRMRLGSWTAALEFMADQRAVAA